MSGTFVSETHWRSADGVHLRYVTDPTGTRRILAALPPRPNFGAIPRYHAAHAVYPRGRWAEVDYSHFSCPVLDQRETASCVGHGAVTGYTRAWLMAGRHPTRFSACYLYGKINRGIDQGAIVSDALTQLINGGVCLEATVPEGMIYDRQFPPSADREAANYRMQADVYHAGSFDEIASGLMDGWIPVYGIVVGDAFMRVDSGGVPGIGGPYPGGHCMTGHSLQLVRAGPHAGKWAIGDQNSWSESWGFNGMCLLVEDHFLYMQNWMGGLDCFLIRGTLDPPSDPDNPPPLP